MAKIKFGDYLKSKERREAVYESDELIAKINAEVPRGEL